MPDGAVLFGAEMKARLLTAAKRAPDVVGRAQMIETQIEAEEVRRRTPFRFGWLRQSVKAIGYYVDGKRISTLIIAGGGNAWYARIVERRPAEHAEGQAYYLGSVVNEARKYMWTRVAKRIDFTQLG